MSLEQLSPEILALIREQKADKDRDADLEELFNQHPCTSGRPRIRENRDGSMGIGCGGGYRVIRKPIPNEVS